jgi:rare lipoprotein A (peptidoglycan hydrolase)
MYKMRTTTAATPTIPIAEYVKITVKSGPVLGVVEDK